MTMTDESISTTITVEAPVEQVFDFLADPANHPAIDGTGRVRDSLDEERISAVGQVFRVDMFHEKHPDGTYRMSNLVIAFDRPRTIGWKPGYVSQETGELEFGGWFWRYDLEPLGPGSSEVTLTYDWSGVGPGPREYMSFPPFPVSHFGDSLRHLAELEEGYSV